MSRRRSTKIVLICWPSPSRISSSPVDRYGVLFQLNQSEEEEVRMFGRSSHRFLSAFGIAALLTFAAACEKAPTAKSEAVVVELPDEEGCCSCQFSEVEEFSATESLPCTFDHPAGWKTGFDRFESWAFVVKRCGIACPTSLGMNVTIPDRSNNNAEVLEETWRNTLPVAGTAHCGEHVVTFYSTPGSEPNGLYGGLKFHVGYNGRLYTSHTSFSCAEPGGWLKLQKLFIDTFRTNVGTTFEGR